MSNQTFTITLTDAQKQALTAKAQAAGINPDGGTLPEQDGCVLSFTVSGNVVTFTVLKHPFYATTGMIETGVEKFIGSAS